MLLPPSRDLVTLLIFLPPRLLSHPTPPPPLLTVVPPVKLQCLPAVGGPATAGTVKAAGRSVGTDVDTEHPSGWKRHGTEETWQLALAEGRSLSLSICPLLQTGGFHRRFDGGDTTESKSHEVGRLVHLLLGGGGVDGAGNVCCSSFQREDRRLFLLIVKQCADLQ